MMLWVDCETTGLVPRENYLLEVGLMVTTNELEFIASTCGLVVYPRASFERIRATADPIVQTMHDKSKLWADLHAAYKLGSALPINEFEQRLVKWVTTHVGENKLPMCGSNAAFDREFLRLHMPDLESLFHYRNIDVSSIKELAAVWNRPVWSGRPGQDDADKKHRPLDDLEGSIAELRYYRDSGFIRPDYNQE